MNSTPKQGIGVKPTVLPTTHKLHTLIPAVGAVVVGGKPDLTNDEMRNDGPSPQGYPPIPLGR